MNWTEEIIGENNQQAKFTLENHKSEIDFTIKALNTFSEAIGTIKDLEYPSPNYVQTALLAYNLNTFTSAFKLIINGYYLQSMNLMRVTMENWLAFWYIDEFPEESKKWTEDVIDQPPPKFDTMRRRMSHPDRKASKDIHELNSELNRFSHTDQIRVFDHIEQHGEKTRIRIFPKYDNGKFILNLYSYFLWLGMSIDAACALASKYDQEWLEKKEIILIQIDRFMKSVNDQFPEEET